MAPFWKRLTQPIPDPQGRGVVWIHGVSVGEIKSSMRLFDSLRAAFPNAFFLITTTTTTGQAEAKRSLPHADAICYLPIDLPWLVHRWARTLKPFLFLLVESDFWPNLLKAIHRYGGKNILVSGQMSARSSQRFRFFSFLSRKLFSRFDLLCVQNHEYHARFLPLVPDPSRLHITGNLKLDLQPQAVDIAHWRFLLKPPPNAIAVTCTHAPEEAQILDALSSEFFLFLAPRHPERFEEVARLLEARRIPFYRLSRLEQRTGKETVLLIDTMGQLPICYSLSRLAILGGSFAPIGGHNLLEPCLYGLPVLFGPHTFRQTELTRRLLDAGAGLQLSLPELHSTVHSLLANSDQLTAMKTAALQLSRSGSEALDRTASLLFQLLQKEPA